MEYWDSTWSGHKSAENVGWDVSFVRDMFDSSIVMLNIQFPLQDLAWAMVVKKKKISVVSPNGKWDAADEVVKA